MGLFKRRNPIGALAGEFCDAIRRRSGGTRKSWKTDIGRLRDAVELLDVRYAEDICPSAVARVMNAKEAQDRSGKTINSYREIISRFCRFLLLEKEIVFRETDKTNPARIVPKRRERAPQIRYLKPEQYRALLEGLSPHPQLKAMVATMIFAGLRRGELLWLEDKDVDLEKGLIGVHAKTVDGESWQPKTRKNRSVRIFEPLAQELARYESPEGTSWYFPSPKGRRWQEDNYSKALRRAQEPLGTKWTCLDFRHTFATTLVRQGMSDLKVATLLGNSPEVCRKHYAFLRGEDIGDEVKFPGYEHVKESPPPAAPAETPTKSLPDEEPEAEPIPALPDNLPMPDFIRRGPDRLLEEVEFPPAERGPERSPPAAGPGKNVSPSDAPRRLSLREFMRRSLEGVELPPPPARQDEE